MNSTIVLTLVLALFLSPASSRAGEIMFEGYYKVEHENKPIGFAVQRYEFDKASKTFSATYFLKIKIGETVNQESVKAKANDKFEPISYQYTAQTGNVTKTIDATYSKDLAKLTISDGKKITNMTSKAPKGTFLSNFLSYLMLQNGMTIGKKFKYSAIAEEDGNSYWGEAWIKENSKHLGKDVLKVMNKFKGENFISFVTAKGEVLGTSSPSKNISTILMATPSLATDGQVVPNKILTMLFGNVPTGKTNILAQGEAIPAMKATEPAKEGP